MRLSDLRDKKIKTTDGEVLGRIHEVHSDKGRIVALMCGPSSMVERWTARLAGHRIPWTAVRKINRDDVIVTIEPTAKG